MAVFLRTGASVVELTAPRRHYQPKDQGFSGRLPFDDKNALAGQYHAV
jgi:hypothetical protein